MGRKYTGDRAWARQHHGQWVIAYTTWDRVRGRPRTREIRLPAGTTERAAEAAASAFVEQLSTRGLIAPQSWDDARDLFLAHRRAEGDKETGIAVYRQRIEAVGRVLGRPDPWELTAAQGEDYRTRRLAMPGARDGETISPATVRAELAAITEWQRWLVSKGWAKEATWADLKRPKGKRGREWLRTAEVGPFLRAAVKLGDRWPEWPSLVGVALSSALRPGELTRLTIRDVDLLYGVVRIAEGKSEEAERAVPIKSTRALELLRAWITSRLASGATGTALVWPLGRRGCRARDEKPLRRRIQATAALAGVPYVSPYGLRHTALTLAGQEVPAEDLRDLAGHRDERTTKASYRHVLPGDRRRAAAALGGIADRLWEGAPMLQVVGNDEAPGDGPSEGF